MTLHTSSVGFPGFARFLRVAGAALLLVALVSSGRAADPEVAKDFDIAAGPARETLKQFSAQSGAEVLYSASALGGITTNALKGNFGTLEALSRLLDGTSLRPTRDAKTGGYAVRNETPAEAKNDSSRPASDRAAEGVTASDRSAQATKTKEEVLKLDPFVVTAQKKFERIQDVPVPVTSISATTLVDSGQMRMQDFYTKIPGLSLTINGDGGPSIAIRGLTTGGAIVNPTVGVVVDDLPFGATSGSVDGDLALVPDFDPSELSRIEVLRGPQGTLYGASSLGGLLKYVTIDPSTDRVSGRIQVETSTVYKGEDLGYGIRGFVNLPLSNTFAVRVSASARTAPGYIDNIQTGQNDVNSTESKSARLAALWTPNENSTIKLSALYQHTALAGSPETHLPSPFGTQTTTASGRPDLVDWQINALVNTGTYDQELRAYSATLTQKMGAAEITSLTGYNNNRLVASLDITPSTGGSSQTNFGVRGTAQNATGKASKFSQELRLSTPIGERFEWLVGAFYTREKTEAPADLLSVNPTTGAVVGSLLHLLSKGTYDEYAAFTDLTYKFTDRFDVQFGARQSHNTLSFESASSGLLLGSATATSVTPRFEKKESPVTYLLTPRFRISADLMVYARLASGYRPGGTNSVSAVNAGFSPGFGSDKTKTYEIGIKGDTHDHVFSFDVSVYRIEWDNIQLQLRDPVKTNITYTLNAGEARSQGVEISLAARFHSGLTISTWGACNDAELTYVPAIATLNAHPGDRLPYSAKWSGNFSVNQEFPLSSGVTAYVGASSSYVGERKGRFFTGTIIQGTFAAYTQTDVHAGARFQSWTFNAYINNVTNKRGDLRSGRDAPVGLLYSTTYIQPRTGGLSVAKEF